MRRPPRQEKTTVESATPPIVDLVDLVARVTPTISFSEKITKLKTDTCRQWHGLDTRRVLPRIVKKSSHGKARGAADSKNFLEPLA